MWLDPTDYIGRAGITVKFFDDYTEIIFRIGKSVIVPLTPDGQLSNSYKGILPRFAIEGKKTLYTPQAIMRRVVKDRLKQIKGYRLPGSGLLKNDVQALLSNGVHVKPVSYNAWKKFNSRVVILKPHRTGPSGEILPWICFGDCVRPDAHKRDADELMRMICQFNPSPAGASTPPKGILNIFTPEMERYDAIGYIETPTHFQTIFNPAKIVSITERLKTHVIGDAIQVEDPDKSFLTFKNSDQANFIINAVVVFDEAQDETGSKPFYLACGEIRAARRFCQKYVLPVNVKRIFADEITVEKDAILDRNAIIGKLDGKPVRIKTAFGSYRVLNIVKMPGEKQWKLEIQGRVQIGSARIISSTGLKGVTVPVSKLGSITYQGRRFKVDLVCGPTNLKAKGNTIALAQLALQAKFDNTQYDVNSMTADEINAIIQPIGKVDYVDEKGVARKVYAGVIPVQITELASETSSFNPPKILPETIMNLGRLGNKALVDALMVDGVDEKYLDCLTEIFEILYDSKNIRNLKVFEPNDPRLIAKLKDKIIDSSTFGNKQPDELLLSPHNKGFFLKVEGRLLRMPSCDLIQKLTDQVEHTGEYRYPAFFRHAQLILLNIQQGGDALEYNIKRNRRNYYLHVFSELLGKDKVLNKACTPRTFGFTAKQIVDWRIPQGVTVVLNKRISNFVERRAVLELGVRNPVLWTGQIESREVWGLHDLQKYCQFSGYDINDIIIPELGTHSILRNPYDALKSQSDCDGDSHSVNIPISDEAQEQLNNLNNPAIEIEAEWLDKYIAGEVDNSVYDNVDFKWYTISRQDFLTKSLEPSSRSKVLIGPATTSLWKYEAIMEMNFTGEKLLRYMHFYQKMVQDMVVRGIKHTSGEDDFTSTLITNMLKKHNQPITIARFKAVGATDSEIAEIFDAIKNCMSNAEIRKALTIVIQGIVGSLSIKDRTTGMLKDMDLSPIMNPKIASHCALLEEITPILAKIVGKTEQNLMTSLKESPVFSALQTIKPDDWYEVETECIEY